MEPVFVCEFAPTVKLLAARIRKFHSDMCILIAVIGIGMFAYALCTMLYNLVVYGFDPNGMILFWVALAYLLFGIFMPEIMAYISLKQFQKDADGAVYRVSFGDVIEVWKGNICVRWSYQEIQSVEHLKYSYELVKNKRLTIMVLPDGFTKGTFEEFKRFLREKRPDLKIPD